MNHLTTLRTKLPSSISFLGWGVGSSFSTWFLHQVHLELLNQSLCGNIHNPPFDQDIMICAGNVELGGRSICSVRTLLI